MRRRWTLALSAWVAAAFLTTLVGLAAVNSLGNGLLGSPPRPLSQGDVASQLASTSPGPSPSTAVSAAPPSTPPAPPPTGSATGSAVAPTVSKGFSSGGNTLIAECSGDRVRLTTWSPAQGYSADHVVPGPAQTASIRFRAGGHGHGIRLAVTCVSGTPELTSSSDDD
jgi:hypothetical protein